MLQDLPRPPRQDLGRLGQRHFAEKHHPVGQEGNQDDTGHDHAQQGQPHPRPDRSFAAGVGDELRGGRLASGDGSSQRIAAG
jgi:hypothetical protein